MLVDEEDLICVLFALGKMKEREKSLRKPEMSKDDGEENAARDAGKAAAASQPAKMHVPSAAAVAAAREAQAAWEAAKPAAGAPPIVEPHSVKEAAEQIAALAKAVDRARRDKAAAATPAAVPRPAEAASQAAAQAAESRGLLHRANDLLRSVTPGFMKEPFDVTDELDAVNTTPARP
jgi:membrane protein involved in colicin uptake